MQTSAKSKYILEKMADWPKGFRRPEIISLRVRDSGLAGAHLPHKELMKIPGDWFAAIHPRETSIVAEANKTLDRARKTGKGLILLDPLDKNPRDLLRHEMTHAIRAHKGKLSSKFYQALPFNAVEEAAAYGKQLSRSKQLSTVAKEAKPFAASLAGSLLGASQAIRQRKLQAAALAGATLFGATRLAKMHDKKAALSPFLIAGALGAGAGYLAAPKIRENVNYGKYVAKHKYNVIPPMRQMGLGWGQALKHDLSKLSPAEFGPYRNWFAGPKGVTGTRDPDTYAKWRTAVEHHYHAPGNLHHYRALGLKQSVVPLKYKMEAVADWYSVQKTKGATNEPFHDWYKRLRTKLPIAPETQSAIDERLGIKKEAGINKAIVLPTIEALKNIAEHTGMSSAFDKMIRSKPLDAIYNATERLGNTRVGKEVKSWNAWASTMHPKFTKVRDTVIHPAFPSVIPGAAEAVAGAHLATGGVEKSMAHLHTKHPEIYHGLNQVMKSLG
jgi:hypothetical protein